jgi:hypothetical protein
VDDEEMPVHGLRPGLKKISQLDLVIEIIAISPNWL